MTFKRLEVHLRSNFSTEASLRDEMSHIEDVYGGKTDFIKQRVLLGYALLKESLEGLGAQDSLAISRVAQVLSQGHDAGSRVERAVMTFARILRAPPTTPVSSEGAVPPAPDVVSAALSIVTARAAEGAGDLPPDALATGQRPLIADADNPEVILTESEPSEQLEPARTNRWAHLKALTGDAD